MSDVDKIDTGIKAPIPTKPCDRFGLLFFYCGQVALHPSSQELDWSSKDWNFTKAKTKEESNLLTDGNMPKLQTDIDQKMDVDEIPFSKLKIRQSDPKEEPVEVTDSLILPPTIKALEDRVEKE